MSEFVNARSKRFPSRAKTRIPRRRRALGIDRLSHWTNKLDIIFVGRESIALTAAQTVPQIPLYPTEQLCIHPGVAYSSPGGLHLEPSCCHGRSPQRRMQIRIRQFQPERGEMVPKIHRIVPYPPEPPQRPCW